MTVELPRSALVLLSALLVTACGGKEPASDSIPSLVGDYSIRISQVSSLPDNPLYTQSWWGDLNVDSQAGRTFTGSWVVDFRPQDGPYASGVFGGTIGAEDNVSVPSFYADYVSGFFSEACAAVGSPVMTGVGSELALVLLGVGTVRCTPTAEHEGADVQVTLAVTVTKKEEVMP